MWDEFGVISYLHMYFGARVTFGKRKHPNAALQASTVVFLTKSDVRRSQGLMSHVRKTSLAPISRLDVTFRRHSDFPEILVSFHLVEL